MPPTKLEIFKPYPPHHPAPARATDASRKHSPKIGKGSIYKEVLPQSISVVVVLSRNSETFLLWTISTWARATTTLPPTLHPFPAPSQLATDD